MDIHAPEHPVTSWRDFGIHIAVVTVGILIALSLEGLREVIHDHALVRETRENFRSELAGDLDNDDRESAQVRQTDTELKALVADLPRLGREHPEQIAARLGAISNPGYFFSDESWQAALSTGALGHMSTEELERYAAAFHGLRTYTGVQAQCLAAEAHAKSFFNARNTLSQAELSEGTERILLWAQAEQALRWVGFQVRNGLLGALGRPAEKRVPGDQAS